MIFLDILRLFFMKNKSDTLDNFKTFVKRIQNFKGLKIKNIRSDHEGEFENEAFEHFCKKKGIFIIVHFLELHNKMEL